jgi:hypothetical protein
MTRGPGCRRSGPLPSSSVAGKVGGKVSMSFSPDTNDSSSSKGSRGVGLGECFSHADRNSSPSLGPRAQTESSTISLPSSSLSSLSLSLSLSLLPNGRGSRVFFPSASPALPRPQLLAVALAIPFSAPLSAFSFCSLIQFKYAPTGYFDFDFHFDFDFDFHFHFDFDYPRGCSVSSRHLSSSGASFFLFL